MRAAVKIMGLVLVTAVSGVTLLPAGLSRAASGEEVIKTRIEFMKDEVQGHWKPLAAFAKTGAGSLADVEKNARALQILRKKYRHISRKTRAVATTPTT